MAVTAFRSGPCRPGPDRRPAPRPVRPDARAAALAALLALALCGAGCARDVRPPAQAGARAASLGSHDLPAVLHGVWHRDDAAGRAQCDRYRALPEDIGEGDAGWMSMVGSLVITPGLVHEYAEYGEGGFNVVEDIERLGEGAWRIGARVGADAMPDDGEETGTFLLALRQERLRWSPEGTGGEPAAGYFRCANVRTDLYRAAGPSP